MRTAAGRPAKDTRLTLAQHREVLVLAGWLTLLLGCVEYGMSEGAAWAPALQCVSRHSIARTLSSTASTAASSAAVM
jgi:hypothetical protein